MMAYHASFYGHVSRWQEVIDRYMKGPHSTADDVASDEDVDDDAVDDMEGFSRWLASMDPQEKSNGESAAEPKPEPHVEPKVEVKAEPELERKPDGMAPKSNGNPERECSLCKQAQILLKKEQAMAQDQNEFLGQIKGHWHVASGGSGVDTMETQLLIPGAPLDESQANEPPFMMADEPSPEKDAKPKEAKTEAKRKAKAKAKGKAKSKPKAKTTSKPKRRGKKQDVDEEEVYGEIGEELEGEEEEEKEEDVEVSAPVVKRHLEREFDEAAEDEKKTKKEEKAKEKKKTENEEKDMEVAAPKRRMRRKAAEPSAEPAADSAPEPKEKKARKSRKGAAVAVIPSDLADLKDDVMKGVILQVLKDSLSLTFDDLKEHLKLKQEHLPNTKVSMNTYWTKTSSAVMLLLDPKKPTASSFSYKIGLNEAKAIREEVGNQAGSRQ
eukprot:Skav226232  [mRNA]  locus=scaffold1218:391051:394785:+ [translate_table: standard]